MIVVDVETSGLDPHKHSIVSIGALDFSNSNNQFYQECRIWDGAESEKEALGINGFSEEEIRDPSKSYLKEIMKDFLGWIEGIYDRTITGENPSFDRDFLKSSAERYGIKWVLGYRTIDLHSICYAHHLKNGLDPPRKNRRSDLNTDKILNYVGLPDEPKPHNALTGAKMEAEAFHRILYGKPLLEEFHQYPVPDYFF